MNKKSLSKKESIIKEFSCLLIVFILICMVNIFAQAQDKIVYDDKGRHDPFIALVTPDGRLINLEPPEPGSKISLQGIIYDNDGGSYAIINEEVVSVGDNIFDYSVFKIDEDKVILLKDNQPVEYKLKKEEP